VGELEIGDEEKGGGSGTKGVREITEGPGRASVVPQLQRDPRVAERRPLQPLPPAPASPLPTPTSTSPPPPRCRRRRRAVAAAAVATAVAAVRLYCKAVMLAPARTRRES